MPDPAPSTRKRQALQACGTFNPRHARVRHRLFQDSEFFDPQDLLQLKYESLRALQQEDYSLAQAASEFGLSRPTLYQAQAHFQAQGLEGLLPGKRGPKGAHKLRPELLEQLRQWLAAEPALSARQLAQRVRQRFKLKVHPRTLEKALKPKVKKGAPETMKAAPTEARCWTERYEALRQYVLEGQQRLQAQPLGLALWVAQGMAGWMKPWRELITPPTPPVGLPAPASGPALGGWQEQLTCVLAQMTLANLQARKVL